VKGREGMGPTSKGEEGRRDGTEETGRKFPPKVKVSI